MLKVMAKNRVESIFRKYSGALKGFISKNLSSDSESEDILQDVFYKFIITDGEEESIENVSSWLYRVARNQIIDRSRKKRESEMPYISSDIQGELFNLPIAEFLLYDDNTPDKDLFRAIIRDELGIALAELPERQRKVFELNELQGLPFKDIASATNIPINTLISQKRYATEYLRKRLVSLYLEGE